MKVKTQEEAKKIDVIVGFSYGVRERGEPGISNEAIARNVAKRGLPLILQWEIAKALLTILTKEPKNLWVIRKHHIPGKYLDSIEVARQAVEIMKQQGFKIAEPAAHHGHIRRVAGHLRKKGVEVYLPQRFPRIPYDRKSIQWWTWNWFLWIFREILFRLICKAKGWI